MPVSAAEPAGAAVLVTQASGAGDLPQRMGLLAAEIVSLGGSPVVRPDDAARRLAPQGLDPITCGTDAPCLADAARRLKVRWVVAVGVGRFGDLWGLDVRVLDVAAGGEPRVSSTTYADPGPDWTAAMRGALDRVLPEALRHARAIAFLSVSTVEPGADVLVDGVAVGATPVERLEVAPGGHRVEVRRAGHAPSVREVKLAASERARVELPLVPLGAAADRGPWPWIGAGTGAVALGAAVVLHASALAAARDANELSGPARTERHATAEDRLTTAAVLYGVSAAAALATTYLLLQ
jgi:hypothetical protein